MATTGQQTGDGTTTLVDGVNNYRIFCQTELTVVEGWGFSPPTQCYNNPNPTAANPAHVFDPASIIFLGTYGPQTVNIQEEAVPTGGHYICQSYGVTIQPNSTGYIDITEPFPINVIRAWMDTLDNQRGDVMNVYFIPNTEIGVITQDTAVGATVLPVNSTVIQNAYLGIEVTIVGANTSEIVNRVTDINLANSTITVETPTVNAYSAYQAAITVTRHYIRDFEIAGSRLYTFSSGRSMGSYVPIGLTGEVSYANNTADVKRVVLNLEFLF